MNGDPSKPPTRLEDDAHAGKCDVCGDGIHYEKDPIVRNLCDLCFYNLVVKKRGKKSDG